MKIKLSIINISIKLSLISDPIYDTQKKKKEANKDV